MTETKKTSSTNFSSLYFSESEVDDVCYLILKSLFIELILANQLFFHFVINKAKYDKDKRKSETHMQLEFSYSVVS